MRHPEMRLLCVAGLAAAGLLAGCASVSSDASANPESAGDKPAAEPAAVAETKAEPRSSWREGRSAAAESRSESRAEPRSEASARPASAGTAGREAGGGEKGDRDLVAQLNEASRELAALRVANAKLKAERSAPAARSGESSGSRLDPAEERLAASLKSYTAMKQELAAFLADIERSRADNAAASTRLKEALARAEDAGGTVARLEKELRAERRARAEAEQAAAKLEEQLRVIARALANAGLSVDKLAGAKDSAGRRE